MNNSTRLISLMDSVTNHVANVHPDHAAALSKRLHKKKIKHTITKKASLYPGCAYVYGFSCAPEHIEAFNACCKDQSVSSVSTNPVCVGNIPTPGGMTAPNVGS